MLVIYLLEDQPCFQQGGTLLAAEALQALAVMRPLLWQSQNNADGKFHFQRWYGLKMFRAQVECLHT